MWAGPGWPLHQSKESIAATVDRVMPDADWVISPFRVETPKKRKFKIATILSDIHGDHKLKFSPKKLVNYLNRGEWDSYFMTYTRIGGTMVPQNFYLKTLNAPIFHLAPCIDPKIFKPSDEYKQFDVTSLGAVESHVYPIRFDIAYKLPKLAEKHGWKILLGNRPPGKSYNRDITRLLKLGYIVGPKYVEALQKTKVFIFGTSIFLYPLIKFCEAMATGALAMSNPPLTMEELHYIPEWNFVPINRRNWDARLEYFITHSGEREEIAANGLDTVLKYHTLEIRAEQWKKFLEEHR